MKRGKKVCGYAGMVEGETCVLPAGHDDSMGHLCKPNRGVTTGDPMPYVITYRHNRTGELITYGVWAYSVRDARERFAMSDAREEAQRIESVKRDK